MVAAASVAGYDAGSPMSAPGGWETALKVGVFGSFVGYAAGLWLLARRGARPAPVLALVVAIQLTPLAGPLLLSRDPLVYNAWGVMSHPFDPPGSWPPVETYGPLWQVISIPFAHWAGGIHDGGAYGFRILAAVCILAIAALVWRLARRKVLAAAFVGWNPFIALHYAGGGHNDALMMVFVLGALVLAGTQLGGASWAAAILLKWSAGYFWALWAIQRLRQRRPLGMAGFAICAVAIAVLGFALYGTTWLRALHSLQEQERMTSSLGTLGWIQDAGVPRHPALILVALLQLGALAFFAWRAWLGRLHLGLASGVLVLLAPRLDPWYALWPIALSAADDDDPWGRVLALGLTGFLFSDAVTTFVEA